VFADALAAGGIVKAIRVPDGQRISNARVKPKGDVAGAPPRRPGGMPLPPRRSPARSPCVQRCPAPLHRPPWAFVRVNASGVHGSSSLCSDGPARWTPVLRVN